MNANLEIAKELALISIDITTIVDSRFPDEVRQEAHMRMQDRVETITTLYEGACQKIPEMSRTEWAQLSSRIFSDYLVFKGAGKGWHLAKEIPTAIQESRFLNHIYSRTASILETMPEVATPEGMVFKALKESIYPNILIRLRFLIFLRIALLLIQFFVRITNNRKTSSASN